MNEKQFNEFMSLMGQINDKLGSLDTRMENIEKTQIFVINRLQDVTKDGSIIKEMIESDSFKWTVKRSVADVIIGKFGITKLPDEKDLQLVNDNILHIGKELESTKEHTDAMLKKIYNK